MAYEVLVRVTVNAETEDGARRLLEDVLAKRLDPTSTEYQDEPHALIDSWAVEGLEGWTYALDVRCDTRGCANRGRVINTITGIESVAEREVMLEGWMDAHEEADVCPLCGEIGHAEEAS